MADGAIELHMMTVAQQVLKPYRTATDEEEIHWTRWHLGRKRRAALEKYVPLLKQAGVDPKCVTRTNGAMSML